MHCLPKKPFTTKEMEDPTRGNCSIIKQNWVIFEAIVQYSKEEIKWKGKCAKNTKKIHLRELKKKCEFKGNLQFIYLSWYVYIALHIYYHTKIYFVYSPFMFCIQLCLSIRWYISNECINIQYWQTPKKMNTNLQTSI